MKKTPIYNLTISQIEKFCSEHKQPQYRAKQLLEWIYGHGVNDFNLMTNLPKNFIDQLACNFVINKPEILQREISTDNTRKYLISYNGTKVETVGIPQNNSSSTSRLTVCISSQAGCAMGCKFCATGKQGFSRNLSVGEIFEQVKLVQADFSQRVSNVVVMGQGEPLLNYENLIDALSLINNEKCLGIGARKITVSTCGIIPGIKKFQYLNKQYGLAVSLHSAIQETRNDIMPGVKKYNLVDLKNSLLEYSTITGRRITFEYCLLNNINDSEEHLSKLLKYCNNLLCHVNLISYNSIENSKYKPSNKEILRHWVDVLNSNNIETTVRESKGNDISAACGQLIHETKMCVSRET